MMVRRIALNGWRNYDFEAVDFSPDINVIRGRNAQGKTNLLEAVYMLATGRSFRSRFDRELVGFGFSSAEVLVRMKLIFSRSAKMRLPIASVFFKMSM